MPDLEAVEVNFDGITYAKGASVIKQLVAYVGLDAVPGRPARLLRQARLGQRHLRRPAHRAGGGVRPGAAQVRRAVAGDRAGQHAAAGGRRSAPTARTPRWWCCRRRRPTYPTLRTHRIGVGLYDLQRRPAGPARPARDRRRPASAPSSPALAGVPAADVLLLNDDDLTYAKLRLDERSMATVVQHIAGFDSSLARALCWAAAWDMVRDAELAARDYVALVCSRPAGRARHQPGHRHAAAGADRADHVRRPGVGADRLGAAGRHRPGRAGRGRAGQRVPARLGARVRRRGAQPTTTWPCCAAGWTATDVPDGPDRSTPSCAGRCCSRWPRTGAADRRRDRGASWTATARPAASGRPRCARALVPTAGEQGRDVARG